MSDSGSITTSTGVHWFAFPQSSFIVVFLLSWRAFEKSKRAFHQCLKAQWPSPVHRKRRNGSRQLIIARAVIPAKSTLWRLFEQKHARSREYIYIIDVSSHGDGVVDSLQYLLCHENYVKPYSVHHLLTQLLTKSF